MTFWRAMALLNALTVIITASFIFTGQGKPTDYIVFPIACVFFLYCLVRDVEENL